MSANLTDITTCRNERDAISFIGLMSYMYLNWDAPVKTGEGINDVTHTKGLNICGLIVDNQDGEILALDKNSIHANSSPVQHGEQLVVRSAIERLKIKRPRSGDTTVEEYYRSHLFYGPGRTPEDFIYRGCTLYTTLEPCPMCTATLCVCRMKRIIYLITDNTFGGSWDWRSEPGHGGIKDKYYAKYDTKYERLGLKGSAGPIIDNASRLYDDLLTKIGNSVTDEGSLRQKQVLDTLFFDHLYSELHSICEYFRSVGETDVISEGEDRTRNLMTLRGLKNLCFP
jgi:tRNA(Arg) A34 adenosine deaminase TadA